MKKELYNSIRKKARRVEFKKTFANEVTETLNMTADVRSFDKFTTSKGSATDSTYQINLTCVQKDIEEDVEG